MEIVWSFWNKIWDRRTKRTKSQARMKAEAAAKREKLKAKTRTNIAQNRGNQWKRGNHDRKK